MNVAAAICTYSISTDEFDESLVKCRLKQITVYDGYFTVELKYGIIDIHG